MNNYTDGERLVILETKIDAIHEDLHSIWANMRTLTNRPPTWISAVFPILSGLVVGLAVALLNG